MPKLGMETIRRRQVIDAVLRILGENGWRDLTVREVAEVAGVSNGILAHYFGRKQDMTTDAIVEAHRRCQQQLLDIEQAYEQPLQRLVAMVDALASPGRGDLPGWPFWLAVWGRIPFDRALQAPATAFHRQFRQSVADTIEQGVALRVFRPGPAAQDIADSLIALGHGLGLQHIWDARAMPQRRMKELLLQALGRDLGVDFRAREVPARSAGRSDGGAG